MSRCLDAALDAASDLRAFLHLASISLPEIRFDFPGERPVNRASGPVDAGATVQRFLCSSFCRLFTLYPFGTANTAGSISCFSIERSVDSRTSLPSSS